MPLVRVRHEGQEFNVGAAHAAAHNLEVIDEDPRTRDGQLRPATRLKGRKRKPRVSVAEKAAEKKAVQSAATTNPDSQE